MQTDAPFRPPWRLCKLLRRVPIYAQLLDESPHTRIEVRD